MSTDKALSILELEYKEINANFRLLTDIRFKLLALVPILGGIAAFVLSRIGLEAGKQPTPSPTEPLLAFFGSLFGFIVSLGIVVYDQRNSELYNALQHRARYLEKKFLASPAVGGLKLGGGDYARFGGQFTERPGKHRRLLWAQIGHDLALALIYGPLLGAWIFPAAYPVLRYFGSDDTFAKYAAGIAAIIAAVIFTAWLVWLDDRDRDSYFESEALDWGRRTGATEDIVQAYRDVRLNGGGHRKAVIAAADVARSRGRQQEGVKLRRTAEILIASAN